jgi:hypothetical protein
MGCLILREVEKKNDIAIIFWSKNLIEFDKKVQKKLKTEKILRGPFS